jgi:2-keto-4-pentenoate hydratase/2-oxohepta-3-ene-1,7-dioic acid hydratase in catechol pathway
MKLATYLYQDTCHVGAVIDDEIVDAGDNYTGPQGMTTFLQGGNASLAILQEAIESYKQRITIADVDLAAPLQKPAKFFGVVLNYADHIEETGRDKPEYPTFFNKQTSCIIGPGQSIHRPLVSDKLDYEGELGIVIGKRCRHVPRDKASDVIAGYLIVNDVSVRDWQARSHTWTLGKSFDTHGPIGPWIVTADELGDPHTLDINTWVNDEHRQSFNTRHLIFDCYYLIEYLSTVMTLEPGDIISTGTSSGVGVKMSPRGYMKPGDVVRIEIEKIGVLENPVIEEPEDTAFIN